MSDYSNILGGLNILSQIPLDIKTYSKDENTLSNLGTGSNLAYSYYKGLVVYCAEEKTSWKWEEVLVGQENTGLLTTDFQYPNGIETFEIDYSNKKYNFFQVEIPLISTFIEEGDYITLGGIGTTEDPYVITGLSSPFNTTNNSYFPRNRNESQFGDIGAYSYDFSNALIGADGDVDGQTSQNGVHPQEVYGALGDYTFTKGYNVSAEGEGDSIFAKYSRSTNQSNYSFLTGKNNFNQSKYNFLSGSFNEINNNTLGNSAVFGQGNYVFGSASLTAGAALINKSFGTTVLGQANLDYINTSDVVNDSTTPLFIIGNGTVVTTSGRWSDFSRSDALKLLKNGFLTLPSVTNALITADITGKSVITKEYLESVLPSISDGSETILEAGTNISITGLGTIDSPYTISSNNDNITQYTDTLAQEAVGTILQNSDNIEFSYNPLTPSITANLSEDYKTTIDFRFEEIESLLNRNSYIVTVGTYEKTSSTNLRIDSNWNWKINRELYNNTVVQNITVPLCENGFSRTDLIVLNQLNTAELILGVETTGTAISPTVPTNKLQAFLLNVGDTDFEEEIPLLLNQVSQEVRVGITETAPSEQAVIDYVSEQTTILDNSKADRSFITGATKTKITYNNEGIVIAGADLIESDIPTLGQAKVTNLTTDLNLKANLENPTFTGSVIVPNATTSTQAVNKGQLDVVSLNSVLVPLNEGNGIGYVINGRTAANFGNVGLDAFDFSRSTGASSTRGATGSRSFVTGTDNIGSGQDSVILNGSGNTASGGSSVILGGGSNTASGANSVILNGSGNTASGANSVILNGSGNTASGQQSYVLGSLNVVSGLNAFALGNFLTVNAVRAFLQGIGHINPSCGEVVMGEFALQTTPSSTTVAVSTDRAFTLGNGISTASRSNAFVVLKNGLATLPSVTNALIVAEVTGKAIATKEFVEAKQIQRLAQYTVATLPTGAQGDLAYVTDALTPTYLGTAVGGGAVVCKVFFNGTNWIT
jgi:hypothetical protein